MVGIPRSSGCRMCVDRRVKCDEKKPACRECERRNLSCPGYPQKYPFCNIDTWKSQESHRRNRYIVTYLTPAQAKDGLPIMPTAKSLYSLTRMNMDTRIMPSLTMQASHIQEVVAFSNCVTANFPGLWACYAPRLDINWLDFTMNPLQPHPMFLRLVMRCLATLHLEQTKSQPLIPYSRDIYNDVLVSLRSAGHPPISDEILATVMLLTIYEMKDGPFPASWVIHTKRIAEIMQCTNADSYSSGFRQTLLQTFRPFLIRAALSQGEACFLEREEWISVVHSILQSERRHGRNSTLGDLNEHAFVEIVKVPGLAAHTYAPSTMSGSTDLTDKTFRSRVRLEEIRERIEYILGLLHCPSPEIHILKHHLGPIPPQPAKIIAELALEGIQSALKLLDQLLRHQLDCSLQKTLTGASQTTDGASSTSEARLNSTYSNPKWPPPELRWAVVSFPDVGWLDRCALSMGLARS